MAKRLKSTGLDSLLAVMTADVALSSPWGGFGGLVPPKHNSKLPQIEM